MTTQVDLPPPSPGKKGSPRLRHSGHGKKTSESPGSPHSQMSPKRSSKEDRPSVNLDKEFDEFAEGLESGEVAIADTPSKVLMPGRSKSIQARVGMFESINKERSRSITSNVCNSPGSREHRKLSNKGRSIGDRISKFSKEEEIPPAMSPGKPRQKVAQSPRRGRRPSLKLEKSPRGNRNKYDDIGDLPALSLDSPGAGVKKKSLKVKTKADGNDSKGKGLSKSLHNPRGELKISWHKKDKEKSSRSRDKEKSPRPKGKAKSPRPKGKAKSPRSEDTEKSPRRKDKELSPRRKDKELSPKRSLAPRREGGGAARKSVAARALKHIDLDDLDKEIEEEEAREAEEAKKREEAKKKQEAKNVDDAKEAEEAKNVEEENNVEEAKKPEEAKNVEEETEVEEARRPVTKDEHPTANSASPKGDEPGKRGSLKDRISMFNQVKAPPSDLIRPGYVGTKRLTKSKLPKQEKKDADIKRSDSVASITDEADDGVADEIKKSGSTDSAKKDTKAKAKEFVRPKLKSEKSMDKAQAEKMVKRGVDRVKSFDNKGKLRKRKSALVGKRDKDKNAVLGVGSVAVENLSSHQPPEFHKDEGDTRTITTALRKNFVFDDMEESDMDRLIKAFEEVKYDEGQVVIKQGDPGDFFYVIASGECSFHVNDKKVGSAGSANSFGELALLYTSPRAATVKADSHPTRLFRVDQKTFRFMMQSETKKSEQRKKDLVKNISFLSDLSDLDVARLSSVMKPHWFHTGDYIIKKGEQGFSFYILQEGRVRVTEIYMGGTSYEDLTLDAGDCFGEDALISDEPRAANVVALTNGTVFMIDKASVQRVLGDFSSVVSKAQDRQKLESIKTLRDADLSSSEIDQLAMKIKEKTFRKDKCIFKEHEEAAAGLYIVREGEVKITSEDGSRSEVIGVGGAFGQEQLLADSDGTKDDKCIVRPTHTATVVSDKCVCGILHVADCREVVDTSSLGDGIYGGGTSELLSQRASLRESIQGKVGLDDLIKDHMLGEGQFGEVWLVRADPLKTGDESQMQEFALKIQHKWDSVRKDGAIEAIRREMTVVRHLNHPCIISLVDHYETEDQMFMLTEAVKGGELWSVIHKEDDEGNWTSGLPETQAKFYALVVADTLAYMHRQNFIFRDLKPENVLIDPDGYPIIVDFGFAKHCPDKTYTFCGTPNYLAAEIVLNRGHAAAVDHWALGIVTYEMITGENPFYFDGMDQMSLLQAIVQEPFYPLPEATTSPELVSFMAGILEKDPVERLGSLAGGEKDILKHAWFSDLDLNELRNKEAKAPYIPDI